MELLIDGIELGEEVLEKTSKQVCYHRGIIDINRTCVITPEFALWIEQNCLNARIENRLSTRIAGGVTVHETSVSLCGLTQCERIYLKMRWGF